MYATTAVCMLAQVRALVLEADSYGSRDRKTEQDFPYMVLKPTPRMGGIIWYAAAGKSRAFNTNTFHRR